MGGALAALGREWGVPWSAEQADAIQRYAALLLSWSEKINLTGAKTTDELVREHLPDSFALATALGRDEAVVDIGSGGGLPAVPLAVLRPDLRIELVEPIGKKVAFLRTAVRELELSGRVAVQAGRAEALFPAGRLFDAASARAVLPPVEWARMGSRLVRPGGRVFVLAAGEVEWGLPELRLAMRRRYLGGKRWLDVLERIG